MNRRSTSMMITLGGYPGAGKGTVGKLLVEKLGYERIGIGDIKRTFAAEMGLTILEFCQIGWDDPAKAKEYDLKYEEYQQGLDPQAEIILDGRLAFWCQPKAFNVFLTIDPLVAAQRIYDAQREEDANASVEEVLRINAERSKGEQDAYKKLYDVDMFDFSQYNLVVDTTDYTPAQVTQQIITGLKNTMQ